MRKRISLTENQICKPRTRLQVKQESTLTIPKTKDFHKLRKNSSNLPFQNQNKKSTILPSSFSSEEKKSQDDTSENQKNEEEKKEENEMIKMNKKIKKETEEESILKKNYPSRKWLEEQLVENSKVWNEGSLLDKYLLLHEKVKQTRKAKKSKSSKKSEDDIKSSSTCSSFYLDSQSSTSLQPLSQQSTHPNTQNSPEKQKEAKTNSQLSTLLRKHHQIDSLNTPQKKV